MNEHNEITVYGLERGPWGFPRVVGRCPSCGRASLFLAVGGHVTCAVIRCPDPCAADELLNLSARLDPHAEGAGLGRRSVHAQRLDTEFHLRERAEAAEQREAALAEALKRVRADIRRRLHSDSLTDQPYDEDLDLAEQVIVNTLAAYEATRSA